MPLLNDMPEREPDNPTIILHQSSSTRDSYFLQQPCPQRFNNKRRDTDTIDAKSLISKHMCPRDKMNNYNLSGTMNQFSSHQVPMCVTPRIGSCSSIGSRRSSLNSSIDDDSISNSPVYVRDSEYVWLPARILRAADLEGVVHVQIVIPENWVETTVLHDKSSIIELEYKLNGSQGLGMYTSPKAHMNGFSLDIEEGQNKRRLYSYEANHGDFVGEIPKGFQRTLKLSDYRNSELPLQNLERYLKRSSLSHRSSNADSYPLMNARDMADLPHLHEAGILYNLKLRHSHSQPYTRVGDIVVALNPFEWIKGLYSKEKQNIYAQHLIWNVKDLEKDKPKSRRKKQNLPPKLFPFHENDNDDAHGSMLSSNNEVKHEPLAHGSFYSRLGLEPHIYETACLAYRGLAHEQQNQSILVSGESGAGKTETVKILMNNLATVEETRPMNSPQTVNDNEIKKNTKKTVEKVLESNPVFEAFGNAKTVRNDNSSRFGKFTQLQYTVENRLHADQNGRYSVPNCLLVGGFCSTYLLEKSRVTSHTAKERSYHIFYQLLAAPEDQKTRIWEHLSGTRNQSFKYIGYTDTHSIEGHSDEESWRHTVAALKLFGFHGKSFYTLMRAICVVLQLGNIEFKANNDENDGSEISNLEELDKLSSLIGIAKEQIVEAMTIRVNKIGVDEFVVKPNPVDAKEGCDSLAKEIYARIFDHVVKNINDRTCAKLDSAGDSHGTISLLDIFGFERFEINRFEQLCINYANERLQQRYVLDNFRAVQKEYTAEGVELFDFSMVDNSGVVDVLEGKLGIISSLNEECMRPKGSPLSFVYKAKMMHCDSSYMLSDKLHEVYEFGIKHFAGPVTYDASNFLQNNADTIPNDLLDCTSHSTNTLIQDEMNIILDNLRDSEKNGYRRRAGKRTVITKFRSQLNLLMETIQETKTRYIRCIKPNTFKHVKVMHHRETMNQLESAGLVTAITISRETFPNRMTYAMIWDRFNCLQKTAKEKHFEHSFPKRVEMGGSNDLLKEHVQALLVQLLTNLFTRADGMRVLSFACGKTKVYFRTGALEELESDRLAFFSMHAIVIQTWARQHYAYHSYKKLRGGAIAIQSIVRRFICMTRYRNMRKSALFIQTQVRGIQARKSYHELMTIIIKIQSWMRGALSLKSYKHTIQSVVKIQSIERARVARESHMLVRRSVIKIQTNWRSFSHQRSFHLSKMSVISIQCFCRQSLSRRLMLQRRQLAAALIISHETSVCAIIIQSWFRREIIRWRFLEFRRLVVLIQAMARGIICRQTNNFKNVLCQRRINDSKAILIQKWVRQVICNSNYKAISRATVRLQAWIRCLKAKTEYSGKMTSIVIMQSYLRRLSAQKLYRTSMLASIRIQSIWRCKSALYSHRLTITSIIVTQANYRGFIARRKMQTLRLATIKVQSIMRTSIKVKSYRASKGAILRIQNWYRGISAKTSYNEIRDSTIIIQRHFHQFRKRQKEREVYLYDDLDYIHLSSSFPKEIILDRHMSGSQGNQREENQILQRLQEKIIVLEKENGKLQNEVAELDEDKRGLVHHAKCLEVNASHFRLRCDELMKINTSLISEITERKHESADLRRELLLYEDRKETDFLALQRQCGQMLFQRESEIAALKHAASAGLNTNNFQMSLLEKKFNTERESHLSEIHLLKEKLRKTQDTHSGYMEKIMDVLEASHSARESEVHKLKRELRQVREGKDRKIKMLEDSIEKFQRNSSVVPPRKGDTILKIDTSSRFDSSNQPNI